MKAKNSKIGSQGNSPCPSKLSCKYSSFSYISPLNTCKKKNRKNNEPIFSMLLFIANPFFEPCFQILKLLTSSFFYQNFSYPTLCFYKPPLLFLHFVLISNGDREFKAQSRKGGSTNQTPSYHSPLF